MNVPEIPLAVLQTCAIVVVLIATATDLKERKIPNKLTFPASGVGIVMQALYFASWGPASEILMRLGVGAANGVLGWFTGVFVMSLVKIFLRKMGHGDTKLVAAVGAFLGPIPVLMVYFYYSMVFGAWSLVQMARAVPWYQLWMRGEIKKAGIETEKPDMDKLNTVRKGLIPVAPFIAVGTILAIFLYDQTLEFLGFTPPV